MTRRFATIAVLAALAALTVRPAAAHSTWTISGYQYTAVDGFTFMPGGYVGVPSGPVPISEGVADDGFGEITNRDPIPHTFTQCTSACETSVGKADGARFDIRLEAGASATAAQIDALNSLPAGTYVIMCTVHPFMRAKVRVSPA